MSVISKQNEIVSAQKGQVWLAVGFRPFFSAAAIFALFSMLIFVLGYQTGIWHYNYFDLSLWHAHEMLFGYTAAVLAGFLLTAVRNWTGLNTASGKPLLLLLILWIAGRVFVLAALVPEWLTAIVDISFLPVLAGVLAIPIFKSDARRNGFVPLLLLMMASGNALVYAGLFDVMKSGVELGLWFGLGSVLLLLSIIAGRVMPFFTERALPGVRSNRYTWVERLSTPSLVIFLLASPLFSNAILSVVAATFAACVHAIRLYGWGNSKIWQQPMLWVLYVSYGWFVVALLMMAFTFVEAEVYLLALHALTTGTIALFTLGMMARVSLGHTGRDVKATIPTVVAFLLLALSALSRVFLPMYSQEWAILAAGGCWILAFAIFIRSYLSILLRERVDGQPG
ncbi:MAG: NnrS family protein [Mariprofundaceae bacterium]